jgi:integrase
MPRRRSPPRLYLDQKHQQWVIRDGAVFIRTSCRPGNTEEAEKLLAQYIGEKHRPKPSPAPLISDILNVYTSENLSTKKTAGKLIYNVSNLLKWWGTKSTREITAKTCRAYAATKSPAAAHADLKVLKGAVVYWDQEYGPLNFVPTFWRPPPSPPRERWLTRSEAARLLWASRRSLHLRRSILLGLYTGSRPGVILALQWDQVDFTNWIMARMPLGSVEDQRKRAPKVKLGRRIMAHLRRWKRLDGPHVNYVCHYNGRSVEDPHASWTRAIEAAGLERYGPNKVTRHTLRHTKATWLMQAGVPIWEVAGFLGMSVRTLERTYGHHSADHQEQAANAR